MTLANTDPPRAAASDDAKPVEALASTWYDPDSADFDDADRWASLELNEDDESAVADDA